MRLKGTMVMELTDVNTGKVTTITEENMVTNAVNDILGTNPMGVFYCEAQYSTGVVWTENLLPVCPNMIGGILLFPKALEERSDNIYPPSDNLPVAYASSNANDQRAVTIECASDTSEPYRMNDKVYAKLIELCVDICRRNGKKKLLWFGDKKKSLDYQLKDDEMLITVHRWYANKSCPGNWLYERLGDLALKVTAKLGGGNDGMTEPVQKNYYRVRKSWADAASQLGAYTVLENAKQMADKNPGYTVFDWNGKQVYPEVAEGTASGMTNADCPFLVKVSIPDLNIRKGAGTNTAKTGAYTGVGVFTILEVKDGKGADAGWGKLKSGAGWISLDFCQRV